MLDGTGEHAAIDIVIMYTWQLLLLKCANCPVRQACMEIVYETIAYKTHPRACGTRPHQETQLYQTHNTRQSIAIAA